MCQRDCWGERKWSEARHLYLRKALLRVNKSGLWGCWTEMIESGDGVTTQQFEGLLLSYSLREHNRDRLRRILDEIGRQGWEIVLMTEIRADEKGVVWLGGDEERVAVIHSERAAIVLRRQALEEWIGEGQRKWLEERVVTVVLGGMRLVSVYQPNWETDEGALEGCRGEMERQVEMGGSEKLVIGGDFNASVGRNQFREGQFLLQQRVLNPRTSIGL